MEFLGFFKMTILFLVAGSIIGLLVVTPIQNHYDPDGGWSNFTNTYNTPTLDLDLDRGKKHDKETNSSYLWAYLVFTYVYTGLLSYFLVRQSARVSRRRQEYLGSQSSVADRTIRISGIPRELRDEDKLRDFVEKLKIGDVSAVTLCRDWREIDTLAVRRAKTLRKLEEAYVAFEGTSVQRDLQTLPVVQPTPEEDQRAIEAAATSENEPLLNGHAKALQKRPKIRTGPWGVMGNEVDAIDFYTAKLQQLDESILEARKKEYTATALAFVTFEKVSGAVRPVPLIILILATRCAIFVRSNSASTCRSFGTCTERYCLAKHLHLKTRENGPGMDNNCHQWSRIPPLGHSNWCIERFS